MCWSVDLSAFAAQSLVDTIPRELEGEIDFPENHKAYFFFAACFAAGLAGALAFAFFLSLP